MSLGRATRWAPLREELARWQRAGQLARLWLRDDDAVTVTPALQQLASLCAAYGVPYLIAAIPAHADESLAAFLSGQQLAEVAAHGWSHRNHAGAGAKAEFPVDRPAAEILHDLHAARARIDSLFRAQAVPIYVPPWNRIAPEIAALLPAAGFCAVSALGREHVGREQGTTAAPPHVNVHLDIIDWRGSRGGREPDALIAELASHLAWAREDRRSAIGILTHHLVHDDRAWRFLEELFTETADHIAVRWMPARDLLGSALTG